MTHAPIRDDVDPPGRRVLESADADEAAPARERRFSLQGVVAVLVLAECALLVLLGFVPLIFPFVSDAESARPVFDRIEVPGIALALVLFVGFQKIIGGYRTGSVMRGGWSIRRGFLGTFATFSLLMMLAAAAKVTGTYSRVWFFSWMSASLLLLPLLRFALVERARRAIAEGAYVYRALSVGIGCAPLRQSEITQLTLGLSRTIPPVRLLQVEDVAQLESLVRDETIDEVYVSVPWKMAPAASRQVRSLSHLSAHVYVLPSDENMSAQLLGAQLREGRLQLHIQDRPIDGWEHLQKRTFDTAVAALALVAFAPVMLAVALAIRLETPGPVIFRQKRRGFNGRTFEVFKFRSMFHDQADAGASRQTSRGDRRVTAVGRFIRRTSLDELPQILNVLRGDMSLVGPRPHALLTTAEGKDLEEAVSAYAARHRVLPGITGLAQVNGFRGELDTIAMLKSRVHYDVEYIENWSLLLDLEILLRTVSLIFFDRRAY